MTTFFLASFNATLRYIVNQRHIDKIDQWARKTKKKLDDEKKTKMLKNKQEESQEERTTIEELATELYKDQLRKEQSNPTYDKFRKTKRPIANMELPPMATSYNRQSHVHSTPNNSSGGSSGSSGSNDSKTLSADAHYSKSIRMLSSNFDQLVNGGNALPYPVYYGEYNQEINTKDGNDGGRGDGGRGDAFVKVENSKLKRRKTNKRRKKQQRKNERGESSSSSWHDKLEQQQQQQQHSYELMKDYLDNVYERMLDYVYEILGVDFDDNDYDKEEEREVGESSSSPLLGGGGDDTATYDEDQFSWSDTKVGSQLIWIYGKLVSLWSRQRTSGYYAWWISSVPRIDGGWTLLLPSSLLPGGSVHRNSIIHTHNNTR